MMLGSSAAQLLAHPCNTFFFFFFADQDTNKPKLPPVKDEGSPPMVPDTPAGAKGSLGSIGGMGGCSCEEGVVMWARALRQQQYCSPYARIHV